MVQRYSAIPVSLSIHDDIGVCFTCGNKTIRCTDDGGAWVGYSTIDTHQRDACVRHDNIFAAVEWLIEGAHADVGY